MGVVSRARPLASTLNRSRSLIVTTSNNGRAFILCTGSVTVPVMVSVRRCCSYSTIAPLSFTLHQAAASPHFATGATDTTTNTNQRAHYFSSSSHDNSKGQNPEATPTSEDKSTKEKTQRQQLEFKEFCKSLDIASQTIWRPPKPIQEPAGKLYEDLDAYLDASETIDSDLEIEKRLSSFIPQVPLTDDDGANRKKRVLVLCTGGTVSSVHNV